MSGTDYPTSNLFLQEVAKIKKVLDAKVNNEDDFIRAMVTKMKSKFDKYWGDYNLLMAIAAILDPRQKMRVVEFVYPQMYPHFQAQEHISNVRKVLFDLYEEYVALMASIEGRAMEDCSLEGRRKNAPASSSWDDFDIYCDEVETNEPLKLELVDYLDKSRQKTGVDLKAFDCLEWWQINRISYPVLSQMTCDILAIPVSTVASEATFSAGTRVMDSIELHFTRILFKCCCVPEIGVEISMESKIK
ncbi:zinc finger BED domain-containing protein RICESLEEPER 1-like [Coffea arabica]|uniref:Zinc finger BED domain-containing protein RICESLEEPER 1-like n=1 Tax=Coffea arabica TaxID=13443 RepID=A0ABM4V9L0_COFAR